jgi:hypothetical protein
MHTQGIVLRIGKSDGTILEVPMRYNASHQRGYRCFIGELADAPEKISEETPRSFEGRSLFEALAQYRKTIEPQGWRLLHAVARRDCWPRSEEFSPYVEQLKQGENETKRLDGFEPADFADVTTLGEQQANFKAWMKSLAPVHEGRVPPRSGFEHDPAVVDFSLTSIIAGQYLVDGKPDLERALQIIRKRHPGPWWNSKASKGS